MTLAPIKTYSEVDQVQIMNSDDLMVATLIQSSQELQDQGSRIEDAIQRNIVREKQIPELIESIGKMHVALLTLTGQKTALETTHKGQINALEKQHEVLTTELNLIRKRIEAFKEQKIALEGQIQTLKQEWLNFIFRLANRGI